MDVNSPVQMVGIDPSPNQNCPSRVSPIELIVSTHSQSRNKHYIKLGKKSLHHQVGEKVTRSSCPLNLPGNSVFIIYIYICICIYIYIYMYISLCKNIHKHWTRVTRFNSLWVSGSHENLVNAIGAVFLLLLVRCGSTHEEELEFVQKPDCKIEDSRKSTNQSTVTVRHKLLSGRVS